MTALTRKSGMPAVQREITEVMVERCRRPAIHRVARAAIPPEAALMRFVVIVTGIAILRGGREVAKTACVDMALHTGRTLMLARQFE